MALGDQQGGRSTKPRTQGYLDISYFDPFTFHEPQIVLLSIQFFSPLILIKLTIGSQPWWTGRVFSINKRSGSWSRMSGACPRLIQMFSLPSCDVILGMWHEDTFSCYNINMFRSVAVKVTKLFLIQTCHLEPGISSFCAGSGARCCSWWDVLAYLHLDVKSHGSPLAFQHLLFILSLQFLCLWLDQGTDVFIWCLVH